MLDQFYIVSGLCPDLRKYRLMCTLLTEKFKFNQREH